MRPFIFLLSFTLLLGYNRTFGQTSPLEGNWQGILKQPKGTIMENYAYWVEIHITGDSINGYARTELANTPYYAIVQFRGFVSGQSIKYFQTKIRTSINPPNISTWCLIQGDLVLNRKDNSLSGTWTSATPNCGSGSILLYKSLKGLNKGATLKNKYESLVALENKLKDKENIIGSKIVLTRVYFDVNRSIVNPNSHRELAEVTDFLVNHPSVKINIQGHTDNTGNDDLNMKLSYDRAKEIYEFLSKNKIDKSRMTYEGFGKSRPMVGNESESDKARNRRVEIEIVQQ